MSCFYLWGVQPMRHIPSTKNSTKGIILKGSSFLVLIYIMLQKSPQQPRRLLRENFRGTSRKEKVCNCSIAVAYTDEPVSKNANQNLVQFFIAVVGFKFECATQDQVNS